jgi:hypothetical protein
VVDDQDLVLRAGDDQLLAVQFEFPNLRVVHAGRAASPADDVLPRPQPPESLPLHRQLAHEGRHAGIVALGAHRGAQLADGGRGWPPGR